MIVSGFRTALDLDTYPLSNLIRPRCAERPKLCRGKPVAQGRRQLLQSGGAHERRSPAARDSALRSRGVWGHAEFLGGFLGI